MRDSIEEDIAAIQRLSAVPVILAVLSEVSGLRFTAVARVTDDAWTACAVHDKLAFGLLPGGELDVTTTLCREVRASNTAIAIDHASQDAQFCGHPTPKQYGFESYVSVPILTVEGEYFGNVCGLDPEPQLVRNEKVLSLFALFAQLISLQLNAEERLDRNTVELAREQQTALLREQFIAVLGHDLRTPLASITLGAQILRLQQLQGVASDVIARIERSAQRVAALVDDVLDFARGRLGGGIALSPSRVLDLAARLQHVVDEVASRYPARPLSCEIMPFGAIHCDPKRIEQVLSNLLVNALEHSPADAPVRVAISAKEDKLVISVRNQGAPIAVHVLPHLFQPFARGLAGASRAGLGLGLFIVSEVAKSHRGTISVRSTEADGTEFTFTIPLGPSLP